MKDSRLYVAFNGTVSYVRAYVFTAFPSSKDAVRSSGCICRASWVLYRGCRYDPFLIPDGRGQKRQIFQKEPGVEHERKRLERILIIC